MFCCLGLLQNLFQNVPHEQADMAVAGTTKQKPSPMLARVVLVRKLIDNFVVFVIFFAVEL